MKASEDLTLKAIYSRSLKSAQSLSPDTSSVDLYSDDSGAGKGYRDLLSRPDIQAVIIAQAPPSQCITHYAYFMVDFPFQINRNIFALRSPQESTSYPKSQ